jgi:hypothetical protein
MYINKKNQKIYMYCYDYKKEVRGLYVYDIVTDSFNEKYVVSIDDKKHEFYLNPQRIPNMQYLIYVGVKQMWNNWSLYTEEVPEWKAETEQQAKNKKENPGAKAAYANGSANIRDNPKGKVISTLNDWTEVLIIEQKNDWYHILYADVDGWTYKDNIRQE